MDRERMLDLLNLNLLCDLVAEALPDGNILWVEDLKIQDASEQMVERKYCTEKL